MQLAWTSGAEDSTKFGIGARYLLDPSTSIRAKVNNQSQLGFGFEQKIRDGELNQSFIVGVPFYELILKEPEI